MIQLTAIVAMTSERVIGKSGDLPWHMPEDLKFFKRTTSGHPIVMGRNVYELRLSDVMGQASATSTLAGFLDA